MVGSSSAGQTAHAAPSWCSISGCVSWSVGSNRWPTAHASVDDVAAAPARPPEPEIAGMRRGRPRGSAHRSDRGTSRRPGRADTEDEHDAAVIESHVAPRRPMTLLPSLTGGPRR